MRRGSKADLREVEFLAELSGKIVKCSAPSDKVHVE